MPNWTHNIITISGSKDNLDAIKALLESDKTVFDFDRIVPMPKSLMLTAGSIEMIATEAAKGNTDNLSIQFPYSASPVDDDGMPEMPKVINNMDELIQLGQKYLDNIKKYGAAQWYDWCCNNWGTKWNACNAECRTCKKKLIYQLDTAWNAPYIIIRALSAKFPEVKITIKSHFEDDQPGRYIQTKFTAGEMED